MEVELGRSVVVIIIITVCRRHMASVVTIAAAGWGGQCVWLSLGWEGNREMQEQIYSAVVISRDPIHTRLQCLCFNQKAMNQQITRKMGPTDPLNDDGSAG